MSEGHRTPVRLALTLVALAVLIATGFTPARAHHVADHGIASPSVAGAAVSVEARLDTVEAVVIEDRVVDMTIRYVGLRLEDSMATSRHRLTFNVGLDAPQHERPNMRSKKYLSVALSARAQVWRM